MKPFRNVAPVILALVGAMGGIGLALTSLPLPYGAALLISVGLIATLGYELLMSRRKLLEANAALMAKSMYLANMSHELRTPLNAIIGFSEIMKSELMGPHHHLKYLEYSGDIHASAEHLLALINDILDLSRIEANRLELRDGPVDLTLLLGSCTRLLRERARRGGLELSVAVEDGIPEIRADAGKLKQIMLNLMTNAVKFTPAGGRIAVTARRVHHHVELVVEDSGIGIAAKDIARALTPFMQAMPRAGLSTEEGTGLGLPLAKRLAELHGGSLVLESELGRGTRVTVTLPGSRCPRAAPAPMAETLAQSLAA